MSLSSEAFAVLSTATHSNAALVHRYRQRDESAFTEIFERHRHLVYRVCLRYVGHHHDAEDITQETFRRAALAMPSVDSRRPLEPWLVTIAANRCRSFLTRNQLDRRVNSLHEVMVPCGAEHDDARRLSLSEQLDRALDRLPTDQRRAFELVHQKELSYVEAARAMGRPLGTVKTWVRRAKSDMQNTLLAADGLAGSLSNDAPSAVTETARVAAKQRSMRLRKGAAAFVASVVVLGCFGIARHSQPEILSTAATSGMMGEFTPSDNEPLSAAHPLIAEALDQQINLVGTDWQWVSLNAFLQTPLTADDLPLGQWMQQTSPTLDHLRSTIEPLGSTLHRVAELFQCELALIDSPDASSSGQPQREGAAEDSSAIEVTMPDEFGNAAIMRSLRCSIS